MAHRIYLYPVTGRVDGAEYCPYCDDEFPFTYDENQRDLEVACPECGRKMMLCSMCEDVCDWKECGGCSKDKAHVYADHDEGKDMYDEQGD